MTTYIIHEAPGSGLRYIELDGDIILPDTTEQWVIEKIIDEYKEKDMKIVIDTTPLDACIRNNEHSKDRISDDQMKYLYNHFILTTGWLYTHHIDKIVNLVR